MNDIKLESAVSIPSSFRYGEVSSRTAFRAASSAAPSLGPLAAFAGTFTGSGFNNIFRPDSTASPTPLPTPPPPPPTPHDNPPELNLTAEVRSYWISLGSVPNRGMLQGDISLNSVPYPQPISDVTVP